LSPLKAVFQIESTQGFDNIFVVDLVGRSGGLALLWKVEDNMEIYNFSRLHINAVVKDGKGQLFWKLTGFYGHPDSSKRVESCAILRHLLSCQPVLWICAGDFNEIVDQVEKEGSLIRRESQMVKFCDALEACHLGDLRFSGPRFTWNNRRMDGSFTRERLDRAVANPEWCSIFPKVSVQVLAARTSSHRPLVVTFNDSELERLYYRRSFKFEAWWANDFECSNVINSTWNVDNLGRVSFA
jgi:hypothetical protein